MSDDFDAATEGMSDGRRAFLKKMAIGTAFTVPVVSSFTMTGINAVYAQTATASGQVSGNNASKSTTTSTTMPPNSTTTTIPPNTTITVP